MVSTPFLPRVTGEEKKGASVIFDSTKVHSVTPLSPERAAMTLSANSAPAYAIERVAEPPPFLALTTSSPPNMMRWVRASTSASVKDTLGWTWDSSGTIVVPAWPPTTGTVTLLTSRPLALATKVRARTTSRVVTPKRRFGSYTPAALRISAAMGTVELTGLEMMRKQALGQALAACLMRLATMLAFVLNKSSRVMPGLRGTPAGITTTWQPSRAFGKSSPV
mmetsp:Transcript_8751/g.18845  ORF Transcript_8751/g.18845 Transcript_8751/m.18845 type:complete len:222 (+) Transcript_8751:378-1043(+)